MICHVAQEKGPTVKNICDSSTQKDNFMTFDNYFSLFDPKQNALAYNTLRILSTQTVIVDFTLVLLVQGFFY